MRSYFILAISALFLFSNCSSLDDKELFDKAQKEVNEKKYSEALTTFEKIYTEESESEFASKSLLECAKLYHNYLLPNFSKEESLKKAIDYYSKIYKEYPGSQEATAAMMMVGFIYANELNETDKAKSIYEEFLKKYPESELASSVKLELESIGLSPEEILSKKQQGTK